jgi:Asp/Glu/hydantoin racemase
MAVLDDRQAAALTVGVRNSLDRAAVEGEAIAAGRALLARHPAVDTIVLECTNLPPYKAALQRALGIPVHDVLDLLKDFHAGLEG